MADLKISQLTAITTLTPATDVLPVVDVTGTTKKITTNQILGSSGTATLASATITGDLTVDTSTLKVDSANDRVGIGTATPLFPLDIISSGATTVAVRSTGAVSLFRGYAITDGTTEYGQFKQSFSTGELQIVSGNAGWGGLLTISTGGSERYRIASDGIATWSNVGGVAGTAMTLNATGLGVGDAPTADCKLTVRGGAFINRGAAGGASQLLVSLAASSGGNFGQISNTGTRWALGYGSTLTTVGTEALIWDSSGNVGIGVTPVTGGKLTVAGPIVRNKGNATLTQNVATTVATLPGEGLFIAYAYTNASNPSAFTSYAVILCDSVGSRVIANNGTQISITTSTFALQVTQIFAATLGVSWSFVQIG